MKKLKLSAIVVCMVMVAALCFSGCEFLNGAQYLTVKEMPKTQFTQDESWTLSEDSLKAVGFSFTIQVKNSEGTHTYVFGRAAATGETAITMGEGATQFSIKGFDLSKTGSHLATIKIGSANGSFQYQVIGNGKGTSESDAIKISKPEDFAQMESWNLETSTFNTAKKDVYYKLTNDIDFGVLDNSKIPYTILNAFSGHLNGNGYTIKMVFTSSDHMGNFATYLSDAELKNINFDITGGDNSISQATFNKIVFQNVDRYGSSFATTSSNRALYVQYCSGWDSGTYMLVKDANGVPTGKVVLTSNLFANSDFTMRDCDNYANLSSVQQTASIFLGYGFYTDYDKYTVKGTFENCNNYGDIAGTTNVGMLLGNSSFLTYSDKQVISVTDCYNYGKVMSGDKVSVLASGRSDETVIKNFSFVTVKAGGLTGLDCVDKLNATVDGVTGTCAKYATLKTTNFKKIDDKLVIDNAAVNAQLGKDVAYYRISSWFEAYEYPFGSTEYRTNLKQYNISDKYLATEAVDGKITTKYYFIPAKTVEGGEDLGLGHNIVTVDGAKYYAFSKYNTVNGSEVRLKDEPTKVEFIVMCYDANDNVIGYLNFNTTAKLANA